MIQCKPCQDEGREQVHHRFLEPEEGGPPIPVCRWHFGGLPHPSTRKVTPAVAAVQGKETRMKGSRIKIDLEELRKLHAQGLHDGEIGEKLGCSGPTVCNHRKRLHLPAHPRSGRPRGQGKAAPKGSGEARPSRSAAPRHVSASSNGAATMVLIRVEILDAMWAQLEPEEKAQLVNHLIPERQGS